MSENQDIHPTNVSFFGLGIAPHLLEALDRLKFTTPTPVQHKAIPIAVEGKDIVGVAQTGTGKTLAFGIPMFQRLAQDGGRGLVLVPTRELAIQVRQHLLDLMPKAKPALVIGGAPMRKQVEDLRAKPQIIVATPGRLIDHVQQGTTKLDDVKILVLDEADRMLDMGFAPQIRRILRTVPKKRQTMLFSATMPSQIVRLAAQYMKLPIHVEIAKSGTVTERVSQELFIVREGSKRALLDKVLKQYHGTVLIFTRMRIDAATVTRSITKQGHRAAEIHSDLSLAQRRESMEGFRSGKYRILVATDIASRGIDVSGIELVINYELPDEAENYIHRIGRTGRANDQGHAITFATPDQKQSVSSIEKLMETVIPISEHPEMPLESFIEPIIQKRVFRPKPSSRRRTYRKFG